jgi:hypothetical protein
MHNPSIAHWIAAKWVLRYLKGVIDHGFLYSKGPLHLTAYCDSDGLVDRRSTFDYAFFFSFFFLSCFVSWSGKKQYVVTKSSTEAEYMSLAIVAYELYWLRILFKELHFPILFDPLIWCDNVSALSLASNPVFHARTKHIEVDYHFVREKVVNHDLMIKFISIDDQLADIFNNLLHSI